MYYATEYLSPLGKVTMACDEEEHLVGLWLKGQKHFLATLSENPVYRDDMSVFAQTKDWLNRYFAGEQPASEELSLSPAGGEFRQDLWGILCRIPYGQVMTYGEIAKRIAEKRGLQSMSSQAVGGAVGHNPISIIIPCHRVVGSGGSLTGYAGGVENKIKLLKLEGVDTGRFLYPKDPSQCRKVD